MMGKIKTAEGFTWETAVSALWAHFDGMYGADKGEQPPVAGLDADRREACDQALDALTWLRDGVSPELPCGADRYTVVRVQTVGGGGFNEVAEKDELVAKLAGMTESEAPAPAEADWTAFFKNKYQEWHVSIPSSDSNMRIALCPDGVPGDTVEEAGALARLIVDAVNAYRNPPTNLAFRCKGGCGRFRFVCAVEDLADASERVRDYLAAGYVPEMVTDTAVRETGVSCKCGKQEALPLESV